MFLTTFQTSLRRLTVLHIMTIELANKDMNCIFDFLNNYRRIVNEDIDFGQFRLEASRAELCIIAKVRTCPCSDLFTASFQYVCFLLQMGNRINV